MGRLEKLVVLTVLFLVATILGVSFYASKDRDAVEASPLLSMRTPTEAEVQGRSEETPDPEFAELASDPRPDPMADPLARRTDEPLDRGRASTEELSSQPPGLLEAAVEVPEDEPLPPVEHAPPPGTLVTREGLEPSPSEDFLIYRWRPGDDFDSLAERYFGTLSTVGLLRAANEGASVATLRPGDPVWIPLYAGGATPRAEEPRGEVVATSRGGTYVVVEGDTLSGIALKVYGSGAQWSKIYDANTDVLTSPDAVPLGVKLRIP